MTTRGQPLRILAACHQLRPSGAPIMLFSLLEQLAKKHSVSILMTESHDPAFVERYRAAGVKPCNGVWPRDFDVFLGNTLLTSSLIVKLSRKLPAVWWIHEPAFGLNFIESGTVDTAAFRAATRIVFPSTWQARDVYRPWLEDAAWSVVPAAIPALAAVRRERARDGRFRLVHVGGVELRKGQDVSIKSLLTLNDEAVELRFVGRDDGRLAREGKLYLEQHPSTARQVVWCGSLSPQETLQEIADADAFVFPTRDDLFAVSVLEAMSLGVPVICSDCGALGEELTDGEEALLVPPGDHEALARAISRMRSEPGLCERLVRNARSRVIAKRPYTDFVAAMETELYTAVKAFPERASA